MMIPDDLYYVSCRGELNFGESSSALSTARIVSFGSRGILLAIFSFNLTLRSSMLDTFDRLIYFQLKFEIIDVQLKFEIIEII